MSIKLVGLQDLLEKYTHDEVKSTLLRFKSIPNQVGEINDVEYFLHSKAIQFEKMTISTTYLVFDEVDDQYILVGYFSIANKPLTMSKKNFNKLSNSQRRNLTKSGTRTESGDYVINSYLIGQLGKNFAKEANGSDVTGTDILTEAYNMLLKAKKIVNARYVWLECENKEKIIRFYSEFGFTEIKDFVSGNDLKVMIMKL